MIYQVRIDQVLQVAAPVVWQHNIHRLGRPTAAVSDTTGPATATLGGYTVVHAVNNSLGAGKEAVRFDLAHGLSHRLGPKGTADLFEGKQLSGRIVLHQVHIGEAALAEQAQDLEAATIDFEGGRAGEAGKTAAHGEDEIEEGGRHGAGNGCKEYDM